MEPNLRDTPLRRFNTFWWGLALFVVFGIACFFLRTFVNDEMTDVDKERGQERLVKKDKVEAAQAAALKVDPTSVFDKLQNTLNAAPAASAVASPEAAEMAPAAEPTPAPAPAAPVEEAPAEAPTVTPAPAPVTPAPAAPAEPVAPTNPE